jgi:signal transduction histidine kinase
VKAKKCEVKDSECHLERIRRWHNDLELNISSLIDILKEIKESSKVAKIECSDYYSKTVELTQAKTTFTFEISHELKAPIASVYNILNVIIDGYLEDNREKQIDLLKRARVRIRGIVKLLDDLLLLSQLEEGTKKIKMTAIDIEDILTPLIDRMEEYARENNISLSWNLANNAPPIFGQSELLEMVFSNIINNGIKYSNPGGIVEVEAKREDSYFIFLVKDYGIGIKKEEIPKIFDVFFRGKYARGDTREGMGLGLSLVKKIIDVHHGTINIKSKFNKGTTVTIRLPEYKKGRKNV